MRKLFDEKTHWSTSTPLVPRNSDWPMMLIKRLQFIWIFLYFGLNHFATLFSFRQITKTNSKKSWVSTPVVISTSLIWSLFVQLLKQFCGLNQFAHRNWNFDKTKCNVVDRYSWAMNIDKVADSDSCDSAGTSKEVVSLTTKKTNKLIDVPWKFWAETMEAIMWMPSKSIPSYF